MMINKTKSIPFFFVAKEVNTLLLGFYSKTFLENRKFRQLLHTLVRIQDIYILLLTQVVINMSSSYTFIIKTFIF